MKKELVFISEIDLEELACRILEGEVGHTRPIGHSPTQAIEVLAEKEREGLRRGARNAVKYIAECMANAKRPS